MEVLIASVITILAAQLGVLSGIYLRLGGLGEAVKTLKDSMQVLKNRVTQLETKLGVINHDKI